MEDSCCISAPSEAATPNFYRSFSVPTPTPSQILKTVFIKLLSDLKHLKQCPQIIRVWSHNLVPWRWDLKGWYWWRCWWNGFAPIVKARLSLQPHARWGPKPAEMFGKLLRSMNLDELLKSMWSIVEGTILHIVRKFAISRFWLHTLQLGIASIPIKQKLGHVFQELSSILWMFSNHNGDSGIKHMKIKNINSTMNI